MVHPAHLSIVAIKESQYKLVAVTKGFQQYRASFLIKKDSPLKSLGELKTLRVGVPDEDSITAWMVRATLRDANLDPKAMSISYMRYQDAIPFRGREQPDERRRDRRERHREELAEPGRQGADAVEGGADQAHHREPETSRPSRSTRCATT